MQTHWDRGMTNAMAGVNILCDLVKEKHNPYAKVFCPSRSILHLQLVVNTFESIAGTVPRCPHLVCALKYNPVEHTWDCSCHGSRFEQNGKLIDNPATADHKRIDKITLFVQFTNKVCYCFETLTISKNIRLRLHNSKYRNSV